MNTPRLPACPKCGGALPGDAPQGLCPRCLAAMNLAAETVFTGAAAAAASSPLTAAELAPHFPQLEILACLGRGGMGVVYKARQRTLNRLVALKLLAPERANNPSFAERFAREAQALAVLNHPNIVAIHDFGQAGGFYYLLMEFVDGVNLRQAMKAGRFTPEQALAVVPPVCEALQYAHEHGIVHRDIKPENLLLDKDGRVKIADFGVAKMLEAGGSEAGWEESQPAGTPQYMAPEQREHRRTDHRADIYSLGVVLYEMLTGELPGKPLEPPSKRVQIDVRLDEIVLRALERQPELRYQTAADVKTVIETMAGHPPREARAARPPSFLKTSNSTLTTPERLATFAGQFFLYHTRGQLILDERQLTHARAGTNTVIPLAAIRDLSIGSYPRSINPMGIDLLSLTYEEGGQRKQVLLSPMEGLFGFPATWNTRAAEWFTAIREAVIAATGRAPGTTPAEGLGVPGGSKMVYAVYLLPLLPILIGVVSIRLLSAAPPAGGGGWYWKQIIPVMLFFILGGAAAAFGGHGFRRRNRGPALPPGGAPAPEARKHSAVGWLFVAFLVGLASLATVVAAYLLFRHEAVPATKNMGANPTADPEAPTAPAGSELSPKPFALEGFTNQLGYARMTTHTGFAPGESCQAWLVHADGRREEAGSLESVFYHGGKESCLCGWSWWLPPPFDANRADEVVTQLRERWQGRLLVCPPGQPITVFTLTNETGARVSGEVQFNRTEPDPTRAAVAEVRVRNQMGNLLFFTSKVPAGYSLHIRGAGTMIQTAHATLSRSSARYSTDETGSWMWTDREFRPEISATAAAQMRALCARGPLLVTNGQPRTVFSVTNTAGDVFAGQFELRGPAGATAAPPR